MGFQCGVACAAAKIEIFSTKSTTTPILGNQEGRRCQNFGSMSISCKSTTTPISISHQMRQCCCLGKRSIGNPCGHPVVDQSSVFNPSLLLEARPTDRPTQQRTRRSENGGGVRSKQRGAPPQSTVGRTATTTALSWKRGEAFSPAAAAAALLLLDTGEETRPGGGVEKR